MIHLLKYGGVRPAANVLGRMLPEAIAPLESNFLTDSIAVIPVPLYVDHKHFAAIYSCAARVRPGYGLRPSPAPSSCPLNASRSERATMKRKSCRMRPRFHWPVRGRLIPAHLTEMASKY